MLYPHYSQAYLAMVWARIAQSVQWLATGCMVLRSNPGGGKIFRAQILHTMTKFCRLVPNIFRSSVCTLFLIRVLALSFLRLLLDFWKICGSLGGLGSSVGIATD
jgi:hypothetical protein